MYHYMKSVWKIGHLQCGFHNCDSHYCKPRTLQKFDFGDTKPYHYHFTLNRHFTHRNGQQLRVYLGWDLTHADVAIPIVKKQYCQ